MRRCSAGRPGDPAFRRSQLLHLSEFDARHAQTVGGLADSRKHASAPIRVPAGERPLECALGPIISCLRAVADHFVAGWIEELELDKFLALRFCSGRRSSIKVVGDGGVEKACLPSSATLAIMITPREPIRATTHRGLPAPWARWNRRILGSGPNLRFWVFRFRFGLWGLRRRRRFSYDVNGLLGSTIQMAC